MALDFTTEDKDFLARSLHIARGWYAEITLPGDDVRRFHTGVGRQTINGEVYYGVQDPLRGQLVEVSDVVEARSGETAKLDITLAGVTSAFFASIKDQAADIEGQPARIYWAAVDQESEKIWPSGLKLLFDGQLSSPKRQWANNDGQRIRVITMTIEGPFNSENYSWGRMFSYSGQLREVSGDQYFQFLGVQVKEVINA